MHCAGHIVGLNLFVIGTDTQSITIYILISETVNYHFAYTKFEEQNKHKNGSLLTVKLAGGTSNSADSDQTAFRAV